MNDSASSVPAHAPVVAHSVRYLLLLVDERDPRDTSSVCQVPEYIRVDLVRRVRPVDKLECRLFLAGRKPPLTVHCSAVEYLNAVGDLARSGEVHGECVPAYLREVE